MSAGRIQITAEGVKTEGGPAARCSELGFFANPPRITVLNVSITALPRGSRSALASELVAAALRDQPTLASGSDGLIVGVAMGLAAPLCCPTSHAGDPPSLLRRHGCKATFLLHRRSSKKRRERCANAPAQRLVTQLPASHEDTMVASLLPTITSEIDGWTLQGTPSTSTTNLSFVNHPNDPVENCFTDATMVLPSMVRDRGFAALRILFSRYRALAL
jgi:hypothetical protein